MYLSSNRFLSETDSESLGHPKKSKEYFSSNTSPPERRYSLDVRLGAVDDHLATRTESLLSQVINEATVADCNEKSQVEKIN